jgi:hypothetical protein
MNVTVRLPKLLSHTSVPAAEYNQILQRLGEVLKFVHKNMDRYLGGPGCYVPVTPSTSSSTAAAAEGSGDMETSADLDFDLIASYAAEGMPSAFIVPAHSGTPAEGTPSGGGKKGAASRETEAPITETSLSLRSSGQAGSTNRSAAASSKRGASNAHAAEETQPSKRGRKSSRL